MGQKYSMDYSKLLCQDRIKNYEKKPAAATDRRTEFEKDYHRIIGSASFRRLQDKTQVFALDNSDFVRTRLTHSLEVSSFAKSLGQSAGNMLSDRGLTDDSGARDMSDILLCAGLIHDIGNPPFGHFGEMVIRDWYRNNLDRLTYRGRSVGAYLTDLQRSDMLNFEGNAQSLRVVAKLHHLVDEHGMNLTKAVLNTIIKYPTSSGEIDAASGDIRLKKMGYFQADRELFENISSSTGAFDKRYPLTFLLEAADDIAYSTADIEDGFKKNVLSFGRLRTLLRDNPYRDREDDRRYKGVSYAISRLDRLYGRACEAMEDDPESYAIQNWTVSMQSVLISAAVSSYVEHQDEILAGDFTGEIFDGTECHYLIKLLKKIAFENIFQISSIIKKEIAAGNIISFLMDQLVGAVLVYDSNETAGASQKKLMQIVSPNYLRQYHLSTRGLSDDEKVYLRLVLVNDFIAGMTDSYAKDLYQELAGVR